VSAYQPTGGLAILFATWRQGRVVKESAVRPEMLVPRRPGPGVTTTKPPSCRPSRRIGSSPARVVLIRYVGPKAARHAREAHPTSALAGAAWTPGALITDGRFSGASPGPASARGARGARRGPIAAGGERGPYQHRHTQAESTLKVTDDEMLGGNRVAATEHCELSGVLRRYVAFVSGADTGAVMATRPPLLITAKGTT